MGMMAVMAMRFQVKLIRSRLPFVNVLFEFANSQTSSLFENLQTASEFGLANVALRVH